MIKKTLLIISILIFSAENISAYSFDAWCDTGQKLYYNIINVNCVEVAGCENPHGELCIPEKVEHNGKIYTVTRIGDEAFKECHGFSGALTLPNTITWIGFNAFYKCDGFTGNLLIPNSVQYIDSSAFLGCMGFTSLTIGEGMVSMNAYVFGCCLGITKIYFNAVYCENFGYHTDDYITVRIPCFDDCFNVKEIVIGDRVQHIEPWAFEDCGGDEGLNSLTIGRDVTSIGEYAFMDTRLDTLTYNAVNYHVADDDEWWIQYTDDVQVLTIGNDVTAVHNEFEDMIYLRKITFGSSVEAIDAGAFSEYARPDTIFMKCSQPPVVQGNTLQYFSEETPIFVPCDALEAYQNAPDWCRFTNYVTYFPFVLNVDVNIPSLGTARIVKMADCSSDETIVKAEAANNGIFECWKNNGEIVSTDESYVFNLTKDIHLTAVFSYPTNMEENDIQEVIIFPNPTDDFINIKGIDVETVEIYNLFGQLVKTIEKLQTIDVTDLISGVYTISINGGKGVRFAKK